MHVQGLWSAHGAAPLFWEAAMLLKLLGGVDDVGPAKKKCFDMVGLESEEFGE